MGKFFLNYKSPIMDRCTYSHGGTNRMGGRLGVINKSMDNKSVWCHGA